MSSPDRLSPQAEAAPTAPSRDLAGSRGATHLALTRLAPRWSLSSSTRELYRRITHLVEIGPDSEVLLAPSAAGLTAQYLAEATGAVVSGVDPSPRLVEAAGARAREARLTGRVQYESAALDDLPYQDEVFDVTIGEVGLGAVVDLGAGIRELVRVTRPLGSVILIQFTWTGEPDPERRKEVAELLGFWPYLLVECKGMLRDAGVVDLHVEDWTDTVTTRDRTMAGPLSQLRSVRDRVVMLWRAWRAWGWQGLRFALDSRGVIYDLVVVERVLALTVIRGNRWEGE